MKDFENLQHLWHNQKDKNHLVQPQSLIDKAEKQSRAIRQKHIGTTVVLATTLAIIIGYFIWVGFYGLNLFSLGIATMASMLFIRIALELSSMKKLTNIKPYQDFSRYSSALIHFYQWRKKIHYIITPIIYISYFIGFLMLLPTFKQYLSSGFYTYVIVSGIVVFFGLGFFIAKQIKQEVAMLEHLKNGVTG